MHKEVGFPTPNVVATTYIYHREKLGTRMTFFLLDISFHLFYYLNFFQVLFPLFTYFHFCIVNSFLDHPPRPCSP